MTEPRKRISGVAARKVWRSIPSQLLRSSTKKFKYSEVERGGRRSKLIEPLDWLEGAGIISVNNLTEGIEPPLVPFDDEDGSFFKVYLLDTGLMFYKLGINPRLWLDLKEDSAIALSSDFPRCLGGELGHAGIFGQWFADVLLDATVVLEDERRARFSTSDRPYGDRSRRGKIRTQRARENARVVYGKSPVAVCLHIVREQFCPQRNR